MATVTFTDSSSRTVKSVVETDSHKLKFLPDKTSVKIEKTDYLFSKVEPASYPIVKPIIEHNKLKAETILPFRVKFTQLTVEGYTAKRPAPVGIAIVGVNNYIL